MNLIKARLKSTSESWIATIVLVLNLVKLTKSVLYSLLRRIMTYSATQADFLLVALRSIPVALSGLPIQKIWCFRLFQQTLVMSVAQSTTCFRKLVSLVNLQHAGQTISVNSRLWRWTLMDYTTFFLICFAYVLLTGKLFPFCIFTTMPPLKCRSISLR